VDVHYNRKKTLSQGTIIKACLHSADNWNTTVRVCVSGFRRDVDKICVFLGYYEESSGNPLPTYRDNVSVLSSRVKKIYWPETSVNNYHTTPRNTPEKCRSHDICVLYKYNMKNYFDELLHSNLSIIFRFYVYFSVRK
jgi:hypothetical protein